MRMFHNAPAIGFKNAKRLRVEMTEAEQILWGHLSKKQIENCRFRRQHPIANFIVDFYCHKAKLIVEVDGPIHDMPEQMQYDIERTTELQSLGIKVIRFKNFEIMNNISEVIDSISKHLIEQIGASF